VGGCTAGTNQTQLEGRTGIDIVNGPTGIMSSSLSGGGRLYYERDPQGTLISEVWRTSTGTLSAEYDYYFDGSGNVLGLVQANGTLRATYTYDPFGGHDTATNQNGSLPSNPFRFAGGYTVFSDSSNHVLMYKFGERYYQPDQGRWTQPDSVDHAGDPAQASPYVYVGDNPVNSVDPSGRDIFSDIQDTFDSVGDTLETVGGAITGTIDLVNGLAATAEGLEGSSLLIGESTLIAPPVAVLAGVGLTAIGAYEIYDAVG
jgi:RHS repeat-associated protein